MLKIFFSPCFFCCFGKQYKFWPSQNFDPHRFIMLRTKKPAVKTPRYTAKFLAAGTFLESASKMLTFKIALPREYSPLGFWLGRVEGGLASLDFSGAGAASTGGAGLLRFAISNNATETPRNGIFGSPGISAIKARIPAPIHMDRCE